MFHSHYSRDFEREVLIERMVEKLEINKSFTRGKAFAVQRQRDFKSIYDDERLRT